MLKFPKFTLLLIRHGQSEANVFPDRMGQTPDVPLTELGKFQADKLGEYSLHFKNSFDKIYSSPYTRALNTALRACPNQHSKITTVDALREYSAGDWIGCNRADIWNDKIKLSMGYFNSSFSPPNGESLNMVERRAAQWMDEELLFNKDLIEQSQNKELRIACFSHGMTIKCLLHYVMGFDSSFTWKISIDNTSVSELSFGEEGWKLHCINDISHLTKFV